MESVYNDNIMDDEVDACAEALAAAEKANRAAEYANTEAQFAHNSAKDALDAAEIANNAGTAADAVAKKANNAAEKAENAVAEIEANTAARHTHSNKDILDNITGIVTADNVNDPENDTDLVNYGALEEVKQQIIDQISESSGGSSNVFFGICTKVTSTNDTTNTYTIDVSDPDFELKQNMMLNVFFIGLPENTKPNIYFEINGERHLVRPDLILNNFKYFPKFFGAGSCVTFAVAPYVGSIHELVMTNSLSWLTPYYGVKNAGYTGTINQFYSDLAGLLEEGK